MDRTDSYARFTVYFPEGEVIYSNAFARYDASKADSPFDSAPEKEINIILTILFNLLATATVAFCTYMIYRLIR